MNAIVYTSNAGSAARYAEMLSSETGIHAYSMLLANRAAAAVIAILMMIGLRVVGSSFYNALCEPEMSNGVMMTETVLNSAIPSRIRAMFPVRGGRFTLPSSTHCRADRRYCLSIRSSRIRLRRCAHRRGLYWRSV